MDAGETSIRTLYEGEDFSVYRVEDSEGEVGVDVTFYDTVTVHFVKDEWNDFLELMHSLKPEA